MLSLKRKILLIFYIANSEWHGILKENLSMRNGKVLKYDISNSNVQKNISSQKFWENNLVSVRPRFKEKCCLNG